MNEAILAAFLPALEDLLSDVWDALNEQAANQKDSEDLELLADRVNRARNGIQQLLEKA